VTDEGNKDADDAATPDPGGDAEGAEGAEAELTVDDILAAASDDGQAADDDEPEHERQDGDDDGDKDDDFVETLGCRRRGHLFLDEGNDCTLCLVKRLTGICVLYINGSDLIPSNIFLTILILLRSIMSI